MSEKWEQKDWSGKKRSRSEQTHPKFALSYFLYIVPIQIWLGAWSFLSLSDQNQSSSTYNLKPSFFYYLTAKLETLGISLQLFAEKSRI